MVMRIEKNESIANIHLALLNNEAVTATSDGKSVEVILDECLTISDIRDVDNRCAFYSDHQRFVLGDDDGKDRIMEALENELNAKLVKRFETLDTYYTCHDYIIRLNNGREYKNPYYLEDDIGDIYHQINRGELSFTQSILVPIYAYEHGDITISTSPFSCRWDSGIVGFMLVGIDDLAKWGHAKNVNYLTPKQKKVAFNIIKQEVDEIESVLRHEHCLILRDDYSEACHLNRLMECLYS